MRWKPKWAEQVWVIQMEASRVFVYQRFYDDSFIQAFRTRREAKQALKRVKAALRGKP